MCGHIIWKLRVIDFHSYILNFSRLGHGLLPQPGACSVLAFCPSSTSSTQDISGVKECHRQPISVEYRFHHWLASLSFDFLSCGMGTKNSLCFLWLLGGHIKVMREKCLAWCIISAQKIPALIITVLGLSWKTRTKTLLCLSSRWNLSLCG